MLIELLLLGGAAAAGRALWRRRPAPRTIVPAPAPAPPPRRIDADIVSGATAVLLAGAGGALRSTPLGIASAPLTLWTARTQFTEAAGAVRARRLRYAVVESAVTVVALGSGAYLLAAGNAALHLAADRLAARSERRRAPVAAAEPAAWVELGGGLVEQPAAAVAAGAIVVARAGEALAVDGVVRGGRARLDTRALDGRLAPRDVAPGDRVAAGARIIGGNLRLRAAGPARPETAPREPPDPIEDIGGRAHRLADATAAFTLTSAAVAALTVGVGAGLGALGGDLVGGWRVVAPLGLELNRGALAGAGIAIADGRGFELLAGIDRLCVDLGALLDPGRLTLAGVRAAPGHDAGELLGFAAATLAGADDAIVAALVEALALRGRALPLASDRACGDDGVFTARVAGHRVAIGPAPALAARGLARTAALDDARAAPGRSVLIVALDGVEVAALAFEPTLRTGADGLFAGLRALGVVPVLTSAEGPAVAQPWADRLDAHDGLFDLDPAARAAVVTAMRGAGHLVACLGADAADRHALAAADVAIAIEPRGATTRATADLTLAGVPLDRLPALVALARAYHRRQGRALTLSVLGAGTLGLGAIFFGFGPTAALAGQVAGLIGGTALVAPDVTPIAALPPIEPSPAPTPAPAARSSRAVLAAVPS